MELLEQVVDETQKDKTKLLKSNMDYDPEMVLKSLEGFSTGLNSHEEVYAIINIRDLKRRQSLLEGLMKLTNGSYEKGYQFHGPGDETYNYTSNKRNVIVSLTGDNEFPDAIHIEAAKVGNFLTVGY